MTSHMFGGSFRVSSMIVLGLALFVPALASAQAPPAQSFKSLQSSLHKGDSIRIEGTDGKTTEGKVDTISDTSLRLKIKGVYKEIQEPQIREIKAQYNDPIGNGIKIGAIIGVVAGGALGAAISDAFCDGCGNNAAGGAVALGLVGAGMGAAIGAVADSSTRGYKSVFKAPQTASKQFGVSPIVSKKTKGVAVAFRF